MAGTLTRTPPTHTSKNAELLARLRALEAIPVYSMTTMASIVTDKCIGLSRAILDRGNKKNKLHTQEKYTDEKVLRLCETIYTNSYKYYDKLSDFMYSLNNRMNFVGNTDAYEGMSLSTEKALEIIDPHLENIGKAIEKELLKVCAPAMSLCPQTTVLLAALRQLPLHVQGLGRDRHLPLPQGTHTNLISRQRP